LDLASLQVGAAASYFVWGNGALFFDYQLLVGWHMVWVEAFFCGFVVGFEGKLEWVSELGVRGHRENGGKKRQRPVKRHQRLAPRLGSPV